MSDEKKKVKDLASELGQNPKDLLAAAKELGIVAAKASTSSLSETDVSRLRNHYAPASDKPEVIVRRRKKADEEPKKSESVVAEAAPVVEAVASATAEEVVAKKKPAAKKAAPEVSQPARVIQRGGQEAAPAEQPAVKVVAPVAEAAPVVEAAPVAKAPEAKSEAAVESTATEKAPAEAKVVTKPAAEAKAVAAKVVATKVVEAKAPAKEQSEARVVKEATKVEAAPEAEANKNTARVVRPAAFSAEPERNASGQTISSAPAMPPRSEQPEAEASTSQVRVISRPDAQAPKPREQQQQQRPRPAGGYQPRPGGGRPAGGEGRPADGNRPGGDGRPAGGYQPRPGGDGRPAGGYPPRAGGDGRPAGGYPPRTGGDGRPAGGAPRPNNFGGQRPAAAAPQTPMPGDSAEQGRKKRQKGRRTVEFGDTRKEGDDSGWSKNSGRRGKGRKSQNHAPLGGTQPVKAVKRIIKVEEFIRVSDLAHQMALKSGEIIKVLFNLGIMATINQSLDVDTATLVAGEFGYEVEKVGFFEEEVINAQQSEDNEADLVSRPPVVTIMGHVDHGKTSLLDALRKSSVVTGEAGGITQHIGAYHVKTKRGEIVFLDTPGHEAFTAMRARGAEVTDIVVLVVAADDGVMEQTREAISHAKAANVPIMVAVNKMDKAEANPDRVKRELSEQGLVAEDWGGDTTFSYVSAKTRDGLDELLELLALQAEILELKANPNKAARGHIVEAKLDKGRGSLGTVLIQEGTLRLGDPFVCGVHSGKVRAMFNDQGKKVKEAGPSMPVEVQGFEGVPEAGEEFVSMADEKTARRIAEARALKQRERELAKESKVTLETFLARKADSVEAVVLNLVVKSDVQGSLEAITDALHKMSNEKVRINVIHGGTGAISESDVLLATASNAIIIGFNVRPTSKAKELAEVEKVDMRFYDIIYKLVEEIKKAMEGMLAPLIKEVFLGTAEVREVFTVPKVGAIAGSYVTDGKMVRNCFARLLRDGVVIYTGKVSSLRRFKDDAREVAKGYECGIGLENYNDIKAADVIEAYEVVEEAAKL